MKPVSYEAAAVIDLACDVQARDWGVPPSDDQPGSFRYGSSHRIMDWIEINTCSRIL